MICRIAPPVKGRSKMKNCKLYYREHHCWLELEEEMYLEIRRERQRVYFKKHKAGECFCRKNKLWLCDGLCETCEFYKKKELSLYAPACLSNDIPMIEYLSDMCDYSLLSVEKERGTQEGKPEKKRYYLANYKIYRERFTTDCFSDYFNELALKSGVGLMDYLSYKAVCASVDELKEQNSYFIRDLYGK